MLKKIIRFIPLLAILFTFTIPGAFAIWEYALATPDNYLYNVTYEIEDFYYSDNLPEDSDDHLKHSALLDLIISTEQGINGDTLLKAALDERKEDGYTYVGSSQKVTGGNLKNIFGYVGDCDNVGFVIHFFSDEEYDIYTYDNRLTDDINATIETYKTRAVLRNGVWVLVGGYKGEARVIRYDGQTNGPYKNVIDYKTWVRVIDE